MMRKNIKKYCPKYNKLSDVGSHFRANCLADSHCSAFILRPVFRNLWGGALNRFWPPLGHTWFDFVDFLEDSNNTNTFVTKKQRFQSNKWHQPHLKKNKQGFKKNIPTTDPNKSFVDFVV